MFKCVIKSLGNCIHRLLSTWCYQCVWQHAFGSYHQYIWVKGQASSCVSIQYLKSLAWGIEQEAAWGPDSLANCSECIQCQLGLLAVCPVQKLSFLLVARREIFKHKELSTSSNRPEGAIAVRLRLLMHSSMPWKRSRNSSIPAEANHVRKCIAARSLTKFLCKKVERRIPQFVCSERVRLIVLCVSTTKLWSYTNDGMLQEQRMVALTLGTHANESYCSQFVWVCVCDTSVRCSCDKMNLPYRSSLNSKGF